MLKDKEIQSVIKLDSRQRYPYLLNKVADRGCLFVLDNNGWCILGTNTNESYLPIWPTIEYAKLYQVDEWIDHKPKEIEIRYFIDKVSVGLVDKNINIVPFPVVGSKNIVVSLKDFIANITYELDRVE